MTENITISLPSDIVRSVEGAVAAGEFTSSDAVLLAALQEWQENRQMDEALIARIAAGVQEGLDDIESGRLYTSEEVFAELKERLISSDS